jgi:hypothetical protein
VRASRVSQANPEPLHYVQRSTLCLVAQGAKIVMIGGDTYGYEAGQMAVYSIDVPMAGRVTRASHAEPYLLLMLDLDAEKIAELAPKVFPHGVPQPRDTQALYVGDADAYINRRGHPPPRADRPAHRCVEHPREHQPSRFLQAGRQRGPPRRLRKRLAVQPRIQPILRERASERRHALTRRGAQSDGHGGMKLRV